MRYLLLLGCTCCVFSIAQSQRAASSPRTEDQLIKDLMSDYLKLARPGGDTEATNVVLGFSLQDIVEVERSDQEVTVTLLAWINMGWTDPALTWDASVYGVDSIRLPADLMWIPDITLYNRIDKDFAFDIDVKSVVTSRGSVTQVFPQQLTVHCGVDSDNNPLCKLKFGSWTYDGLRLNLTYKGDVDLSTYNSRTWQVTNTSAYRSVVQYECCIEPYIDITYTIGLSAASPLEPRNLCLLVILAFSVLY